MLPDLIASVHLALEGQQRVLEAQDVAVYEYQRVALGVLGPVVLGGAAASADWLPINAKETHPVGHGKRHLTAVIHDYALQRVALRLRLERAETSIQHLLVVEGWKHQANLQGDSHNEPCRVQKYLVSYR